MTPREMLDVQRRLVEYADKFNADGLPVSFKPEFVSEDVYNNMIQAISEDKAFSANVRAAADTGTYIKPMVEEVPYDVEFQPGVGFYAASGLRTLNETAFEDFVMPKPSTGAYVPTITTFKSIEIITEEEHNREQELEAMSTFALGKNALGQRVLTATNVRLAQVSKTILVRYDVIENNPRTVNSNTLKFSPEALEILNNYGAADFSREFGDYFVAGYKWGLRFQAVISVTSDSTSVLDKACAGIRSIVFLAQYGSPYSELVADVEALGKSNYLNIDVEEVTIDGGNPRKGTFSTESSVKAVADALASFARQARTADKSSYSPVQVVLRRYREVPAAKNIIPELLPMAQSHFNAILDLNKTIFRTRCYYNALVSIPVANLVDGSSLRNQWQNEFHTMLDTTRNQINYICGTESRARDYQARFQKLCDKYRALCERYVFYRRLMEEQAKNKRGFWNSDSDKDEYVSAGIKTYAHSSIVMGDYGKYADAYHYDNTHTKSAKFGTYYMWTITGDQSNNNWRYVWFETGCHDTNKSKGEDQAFPTVGSKKLKWYFEGGTWRRVEWYFRDKIILMKPENYPFVGLQD